MRLVKNLNKWANRHSSNYIIDIFRITLGIFLFMKGLRFMNDTNLILEVLGTNSSFMSDMIVVHYVSMVHLIGGVLIIFGLLTRWSVLAQIPIVIGALLVNFIGEFSAANTLQASVILITLLVFLIIGAGKHSADYSLKMQM